MSDWKSQLIQAYRFSTAPYRKLRMMNMASRGKVPIIVLFYHRVADDYPNDWTMTRAEFKQQIEWFQDQFEIVDLQECQRRIASGSNAVPTLSITFDDGYAENAEFALPLLIERRIPVTYFVTTEHTTRQKPFPHDVELGRPLPVNTLASLLAMDMAGVEIGGHTRSHVDLGSITDPVELADEVITASREMGNLIGRPIRYFAFPFGQRANLNRDAFAMLKAAGFLGVCSAYGGWNEVGEDPFHLQRMHGDPNLERMKNWLTYDPRIAKVPRFDFAGGTFDPDLIQKAITAADFNTNENSTKPSNPSTPEKSQCRASQLSSSPFPNVGDDNAPSNNRFLPSS